MLQLLFVIAFAAVFYKLAQVENMSGFLWAALSVLTWLAIGFLLHWGLLGRFLGQIGLFAAMTICNIIRSKTSTQKVLKDKE